MAGWLAREGHLPVAGHVRAGSHHGAPRQATLVLLVIGAGAWGVGGGGQAREPQRHLPPPPGAASLSWGSAPISLGSRCCVAMGRPLTSLGLLLPAGSRAQGQLPRRCGPQVWVTGPGPCACRRAILVQQSRRRPRPRPRTRMRRDTPQAHPSHAGASRPRSMTRERARVQRAGRGRGRTLTALPLRVVGELAERHLHREDEAAEHDLDADLRDGHVHLDADLGDDDAVFPEAGAHHLVVEDDLDGETAGAGGRSAAAGAPARLGRAGRPGGPHLVGHHPSDGPAGQHHAVLLVLDNDGLRAGQPVLGAAEVVVHQHPEVPVHGHDLLHQHVGAVVQEGVVGAVEGDVVRVAPAAAHACGQEPPSRAAPRAPPRAPPGAGPSAQGASTHPGTRTHTPAATQNAVQQELDVAERWEQTPCPAPGLRAPAGLHGAPPLLPASVLGSPARPRHSSTVPAPATRRPPAQCAGSHWHW